MLVGKFKRANKLPDSLNTPKDGILAIEWMFPEEDFEGSFILMLFCLIVGQRAGELIEIVEEEIDCVG